MDQMQAGQGWAPPDEAGALVYDGRLSDLYRIFWRNLLLTVLTLGFFRFWAVTRNRRYLWAHMRFRGDRFEYAGTGGEKLRGFLLVSMVLGVLYAINLGIGFSGMPPSSPVRVAVGLIYPAALLLLGQVAPFTAQRYRLSRSLWRGVGGGMVGSAVRYGVAALLYTVANIATLFMLRPLQRLRMIERRVQASSFGDTRLQFVRARGLAYPAFFGALLLKFLVVLIACLGGAGAVYLLHGPHAFDAPAPAPMPVRTALVLGFALVLLVPALNRLCNSWYDAAVLRRVLQRTRYLDLRFASTVSGNRLFVLRLTNLLIGLGTLGLGAPIVRQRCAVFVARGITVTGALDADRLQRDSAPIPSQGEGLFEAFDVGLFY